MEMLRNERLHAITYQSPELDGALSLQVAIDWFNGLQVEPIRYLPKHIITRADVEEFLFGRQDIEDIDLDELYQLICDCNRNGVDAFFDQAYRRIVSTKVIPIETFRGFCIEVLSDLISIVKSRNLKIEEIIGGYESLFKNLFNQKTLEKTLEWMKKTSGEIINGLCWARTHPKSPVQKVVEYVDGHYGQPLSLKTLSYKFNFSAAYLGRLFRRETGKTFPRYLNEVRIEKAKDLLRTSSFKANQIARKVGYTDPNYFYDIFKRYTGLSPTEFVQSELETARRQQRA
jgi:two-component system response regulator YesN